MPVVGLWHTRNGCCATQISECFGARAVLLYISFITAWRLVIVQEPLSKWHTLLALAWPQKLFGIAAVNILAISRTKKHLPRIILWNRHLQMLLDIWMWSIADPKTGQTTRICQGEPIDISVFWCAYHLGLVRWPSLLQLLLRLVGTLLHHHREIKFLALHDGRTYLIWCRRWESLVSWLLLYWYFRCFCFWSWLDYFGGLIKGIYLDCVCAFLWSVEHWSKKVGLHLHWPLTKITHLLKVLVFIWIFSINNIDLFGLWISFHWSK